MMHHYFSQQSSIKVTIDSEDAWVDTVTLYKSKRCDINKQLQVQLDDQPALDTGGVRMQLYSTVLVQFAENNCLMAHSTTYAHVAQLNPGHVDCSKCLVPWLLTA